MLEFRDKTALITGGASGIGLAIAKKLANEGMKIALADIDESRVKTAVSELNTDPKNSIGLALDVSNYEDWQQKIAIIEENLGPICVLINSAGISGSNNLWNYNIDHFKKVMAVNAFGPFHGCHALIPKMLAADTECYIVNIASMSGLITNPGMSAYDASKHALVGLSESLRAEIAGTKIGISIVCPGIVATDFTINLAKNISQYTNNAPPNMQMAAYLKSGISADALAEMVIKSMKNNDFYVFTHANWKEKLQQLYELRLAAFGEGADPNFIEDKSILENLTKDSKIGNK